MKSYKRLVALGLSASIVGSSWLSGGVSNAQEVGGMPPQAVEGEKRGGQGQADQGTEKKENSWRYEEGGSITQIESYSINPENWHPDAWKKVNGVYVNSQGNPIPGAVKKSIDVSEHQKKIDWEKVKADGINFAILRCGYGRDVESQDDKWWKYNVSECERLGIPYGVYLYSYATDVELAKSEAAHALRLLKGHTPTYPVYLDMEDRTTAGLSNETLGQIAKTFNDMVSAAGYQVGVYANLNWWSNKLTDPVFDNPAWSKWVAQYNITSDYQKPYDMWQSTSKGAVDGIGGYVDLNFWMKGLPFTDMGQDAWFYESVQYLYDKGIMTGLTESTFGPLEKLGRGQFATVLYRMEGSPQVEDAGRFPDVADGEFYTNAVMWASQAKIVTGYENGNFGPADNITREQIATMLYGYAKYKGVDVSAEGNLDKFPDKDKVSMYAFDALKWCVNVGIISGNGDGTLAPIDVTDRASTAAMLKRYLTKIQK